MAWWTRNGNWAVPALWIIYGVVLAAIWVDHYFDASTFCDGSSSGAECARAWISSLTGVTATVAAAATGIIIWRQVREQKVQTVHLAAQNTEQSRQTDFLLGNADPTIDAIQHQHRSTEAVIRIVNWNRRPILVLGLTVLPTTVLAELQKVTIAVRDDHTGKGLAKRLLRDGRFVEPIPMHGWKNRSAAPCEIRVDIKARPKGNGPFIRDWTGISVSMPVQIAGDDGKSLLLSCGITNTR